MNIEQRHPSERVTPVEVGDPIRWTASEGTRADIHGTVGRGSRWRYLVGPLDDVFQAVVVLQEFGHGGAREHHQVLRHCQSLEAAQQACQDYEHMRAWGLLTDTAKAMLQGVQNVQQVAA